MYNNFTQLTFAVREILTQHIQLITQQHPPLSPVFVTQDIQSSYREESYRDGEPVPIAMNLLILFAI